MDGMIWQTNGRELSNMINRFFMIKERVLNFVWLKSENIVSIPKEGTYTILELHVITESKYFIHINPNIKIIFHAKIIV